MQNKYTYSFEDGNKDMIEILGGKGANLSEMVSLGIPVPSGFVITTESCALYYKNNKSLPSNIKKQIDKELSLLEKKIKKKLGDKNNPLLVSVRSGASVSMPGMMDTILNLGLNDVSVEALAEKTSNRRFALDSYRRFIQMYANVVEGIESKNFEKILDEIKKTKKLISDTEFSQDDLEVIIEKFKKVYKKYTKKTFPQSPKDQLYRAIEAVFESWNNDRAISYRKMHGIDDLLGTAVTVQEMVFGNMGEDCATGVCFSRNPSTGKNEFYGEYLVNAQGEDVVAGVRTPIEIKMLKKQNPKIYKRLVEIKDKLETHYKDVQDMEFTIEKNKLYFLQTRNGKTTVKARIKIVVDLVDEGILTKQEALLKIDPNSLNQLLHKQFKQKDLEKAHSIATGLAASPGAAVGEIVFSAKDACEKKELGKNVILVRKETSPEDIEGINSAVGILTSTGGMTSHAAVVARGMGKCCVCGCAKLNVDEEKKIISVGKEKFFEGDIISIDGSTGKVYKGEIPVEEARFSKDFLTIMKWSDEFRRMKVRTNADTKKDAKKALELGAEGIGLCRTEHMFFEQKRLKLIRELILADNSKERQVVIEKLLPLQTKDFLDLFSKMEGLPVNVRLLDPPLHEFLPTENKEIKELAEQLDISQKKLKQKILKLQEVNPMLGHRGCRLGITYPEITKMQVRAMLRALKEKKCDLEIMVPLVGSVEEFKNQKEIILEIAREQKINNLKIGVMIEVPRAALRADEIALEAEFFSFGTNDLTQMTLGFSRDDIGKFIQEYLDKGIYKTDPFVSLDQTGVGELIKIATKKAKKVKKNIKLGICGEHGGDPSSIEFFHSTGLDYVSCSPFRVPIARLVCAQATIKQNLQHI